MIIGSDLVRLRGFVFLERFLICREDRIKKVELKVILVFSVVKLSEICSEDLFVFEKVKVQGRFRQD